MKVKGDSGEPLFGITRRLSNPEPLFSKLNSAFWLFPFHGSDLFFLFQNAICTAGGSSQRPSLRKAGQLS